MTPSSRIVQLVRPPVIPTESTAPAGVTCEQWRDLSSGWPAPCEHLHDTTTRYDRDAKLLTFLFVCPVCRTEKVIETREYEPRFEPQQPAAASGGGTVHELPVRRHEPPARRAA